MKVLILGAGAMGSLFGGRLAESLPGWDVTLADVWGDHVAAINQHGLKLEDEQGSRMIKARAVLTSEVSRPADLIMVFTKVIHTESALASAQLAIGPDTWLMSLQNGLGAKEKLARFGPLHRVICGMTTYTSDMVAPGWIRSAGQGITRMMTADGQPDPMLTAISKAMISAGLDGRIDPDVETHIWQKVGFNAAFNALCAITRLDCGGLGQTEAGRSLLFAVAGETAAVANKKGIKLQAAEVIELLSESIDRHARHAPSMLQDVLAGRPTEIEALNGEIIRLAKEEGLEVPVNETAYKLIKAISGAYAYRL